MVLGRLSYLGLGLFSLRLCGYVSFIGSAKDMFERNVKKKHVALFNVCIGFLPGKKSLGKVSSSFSQFFLLLASGESEEIRAVLENQFDLPRPLLPKHHA